MKIEIVSADVREISGTSSKTGKAYNMKKQDAYVHLDGQKYPVKFEFTLEDKATPYAPGWYSLDESSYFVDRFSNLQLGGTLKLTPTQQVRAA